jgi:phytol kinase
MLAGGSGMATGFVVLFCSLGYFDCDMGAMAGSIGTIALIATIIESLPVNKKLDDNISVPGAVALLGFLLRSALVVA